VSIDPTQSIGLIENHLHPADVSLWSLARIDPGPGYAAAIAVEGHDWNMAFFDVPGSQESGSGIAAAAFLPEFHDHTATGTYH
jgi:hypothetical protein